jgi:integrase/recombinase XerC
MLSSEITHFLAYCKLSGFSDKSLETLTFRLREFNTFLTDTDIDKPADLTYDTLRVFINAAVKKSLHIKKAKIWSLRQFCHFCVLNGYMEENIALGFPYPKIDKTVPKYLTIEEYNQLLAYFYFKAVDEKGLRDFLNIQLFGLLGVRLASIIALNTDEVDLVSGVIWVVEKGGKERNLILPKILCRSMSQMGSSPFAT